MRRQGSVSQFYEGGVEGGDSSKVGHEGTPGSGCQKNHAKTCCQAFGDYFLYYFLNSKGYTCYPCKLYVRSGARYWDKEVKVQEPLPNPLIKQQQEVDSYRVNIVVMGTWVI